MKRKPSLPWLPPGFNWKNPCKLIRYRGSWDKITKKYTNVKYFKTVESAMSFYSILVQNQQQDLLMSTCIDRYLREVSPELAPSTHRMNYHYAKSLYKEFGSSQITDITTPRIWQFRNIRGALSESSANKEINLLSAIFRAGRVRWGLLSQHARNPCEEVPKFKEKVRNRIVTNEEFEAVYNLASPFIKCLMKLAVAVGQRRGDLLSIQVTDIQGEVLRFYPSKSARTSNKYVTINITPELREILEECKKIHKTKKSFYLFCTRDGSPYTANGINSIWQRLMKKALTTSTLKDRYRFHDLRSMSADMAESLNHATMLLGHSNSKITERVYRRKERPVEPIKLEIK